MASRILGVAGQTLFLEDGSEFIMPWAMTARYMPTVGDFFMVYDDGYQAISPRKAFEEGYAEIVTQTIVAANDPSPLPQLEG